MRSFNACGACRRQYDVTQFEPGVRLRCGCGEHFQVEHRKPHSPRALLCSNCGGVLRDQARECEYCCAEITLEERRLDSICPDCSARMASDARYCMECGVEIRPQAVAGLPEAASCPRCKSALVNRTVGDAHFIECRSCAGLWLAHEAFQRLCERVDEGKLVARSMPTAEVLRNEVSERVVYLSCPICGEFMNRRNYSNTSGVILDVCRPHGVWLDHTELQKVMQFIESGGLSRARQREVEQLESARRKAALDTQASVLPGMHADIPLRRRPTVFDAIGWLGSLFG